MKRLDQKRDYVVNETSRLEALVIDHEVRITALEAAPAGSVGSVTATVDFGASFTHYATVAVTGQAWVTALSKIVAMPSGGNPMENAILQFSPTVSDLVVGDGFTLSVYTPAKAKGTYTFSCLGV